MLALATSEWLDALGCAAVWATVLCAPLAAWVTR